MPDIHEIINGTNRIDRDDAVLDEQASDKQTDVEDDQSTNG